MSASRASQELAQKTDITPSVNRQTEATAADFIEIGEIFDDHANRLDELQNELYHADFVGYYGSLASLQANYPTAPANAFAIIVNGSNIPQQIYRWENNTWTLIFVTEAFVSYNSKTQFPNPGVVDKLYFAIDSRLLYLWLNNLYIAINQSNPPSFYDTYQVIDPATLAVVDFSAGANFYFIEEINTELMHFAVKQTQKDAAAFDGARVHIDGNNYDLENPISQNGYDIYLLGSADNIRNPNGNNLPFNVWSFGGGGAAELSETVISTGGSKHNFNLDGNNVVVFNTSSNSTLTGLESGEIKEVIIINKGTGAVDVPSNSSNSASSNRFQFAIPLIKIPQNGVLRVYFSEIDNAWKVVNLEGIPTNLAHLGLTNDNALIVNEDGSTKTVEVRALFVFDDVKTDLYTTDSQLNTDYPDHLEGEGVFISNTHQFCRKLDDSGSGKWSKQYVDDFETALVSVTPSADVNNSTVQYKRLGRTVKVQGVIETNNISPVSDITCFTLPIGYRPTYAMPICLPVSFNSGAYEPHFCTLSSNGTFTINNCQGVAAVAFYLEFTI